MVLPLIALFLPNLGTGGAEKAMVTLANCFSQMGHPVDMVLASREGEFLRELSPQVKVVDLQASRVFKALVPLTSYLRAHQPRGLISSMPHCNVVALVAARLARTKTRIIPRQENTMSHAARNAPDVRGHWIPFVAKNVYPWAHAVVAVSNGVADDLFRFIGIPRERIRTIHSPCTIQQIQRDSVCAVNHQWFADSGCPVIISLGRLHVQKNHETLLRAFRIVRDRRQARLVIIGEGPEREKLILTAQQLGIMDDFWLPGFVANPFAYLAKASVFVLSSRWEGLGLVLVEAMACGTPVVSTDCPSGPREILEDGRYGLLVPVGDVEAMADAMEHMIDSPVPKEVLRSGVERFSPEKIAREYLKLIME